jgi:hypothetical protein
MTMSPMRMSKTWQRRIQRARRDARRVGVATVIVFSLIGAAAGIKVFLTQQHPDVADVAAIANRVANQRAAAGQHAADFVAAVLTTPSDHRAALRRFITMPEPEMRAQSAQSAPAPAPAVIDPPCVWSVIPEGPAGDADLYSATVKVMQRPYASAEPVRAFYRVPVAIWQYQPRVMDWPAPISDPGPGADIKAGYGHPLSPTSPVYAVANGFVNTYLTATTGLDRYVVAGSWIRPIGGYQSAVIEAAEADTEIAENPRPGARIRLRAQVLAQTSQFATVPFAFPLTVENSDGTWMVADIDLTPKIARQWQ